MVLLSQYVQIHHVSPQVQLAHSFLSPLAFLLDPQDQGAPFHLEYLMGPLTQQHQIDLSPLEDLHDP